MLGLDSSDGEGNVHWTTIMSQRVRFIDIKSATLKQQSDIDYDHYVTLTPTDMVDLKVLTRHHNSNLILSHDLVVSTV